MGAELVNMLGRVEQSWAKLSLFSLAQDGTRVLCTAWTAPIEKVELLEQIEERALRQANVLGGAHAFMIEAWDAKGAPLGTELFRVTAETLPNGVSLAHEPANDGGLLAQLMRHNEAQTRTGVLGFEKTSAAMLRVIETTTKHTAAVEGRYGDLLLRLEQMVLGERETRVELARVEGRSKVMNTIAERVAGVLPEVLGSIAGKVSNTAGAAAAIKAKGAFETLRPEQLQTILEVLDMDQKIAVMGLLKTLAEDSGPAEKKGAPSAH